MDIGGVVELAEVGMVVNGRNTGNVNAVGALAAARAGDVDHVRLAGQCAEGEANDAARQRGAGANHGELAGLVREEVDGQGRVERVARADAADADGHVARAGRGEGKDVAVVGVVGRLADDAKAGAHAVVGGIGRVAAYGDDRGQAIAQDAADGVHVGVVIENRLAVDDLGVLLGHLVDEEAVAAALKPDVGLAGDVVGAVGDELGSAVLVLLAALNLDEVVISGDDVDDDSRVAAGELNTDGRARDIRGGRAGRVRAGGKADGGVLALAGNGEVVVVVGDLLEVVAVDAQGGVEVAVVGLVQRGEGVVDVAGEGLGELVGNPDGLDADLRGAGELGAEVVEVRVVDGGDVAQVLGLDERVVEEG